MLRPLRFLAWPVVLGIVLASGMGCPTSNPPNYLPGFLYNPASLDFGTDATSLKLQVSKSYTNQPLPEFTVSTGGVSWLSVTPKTGNSSGPDDIVEFTVTVDRSKMTAGSNTASLILSAPGVADQEVPVTATARLVARFSGTPLLIKAGKKVHFTDESSAASSEGPIQSWLWKFGDGKTSTKENPSHRYTAPGAYTVSLMVSTAGSVNTFVRHKYIVVISDEGPTAKFVGAPKNPPANTPVQFTDLSVANGAPINSWHWEFGDTESSSDQHPSHIYTTPGQYTVSLTVTDASGAPDTLTKTDYIDVQPVGPTAEFEASTQNAGIGQTVQFSDLSDPGTSPITSWLWLFGDGGSSLLMNPTHAYQAAGVYTVYLSVTTVVGSDTETKTDYITITP